MWLPAGGVEVRHDPKRLTLILAKNGARLQGPCVLEGANRLGQEMKQPLQTAYRCCQGKEKAMTEAPGVFYDHYYDWAEIVRFLSLAAEAHPHLLRLEDIGQTPEGRPVLCAQITGPQGDPDGKPGYLVQANVHAGEVAGTTASLYLVKHLLEGSDKDPAVERLLQEIVFYIVPRMNPDGAEFIVSTGGVIRSRNTPRYRKNGLCQMDVDGDGLILSMRKEDPRGNMKPHSEDARLMIPREGGDAEGPFYFVYNEGMVHDWDGGPIVNAERSADFNRNWGANWHPEYEQGGAGDFPFSQPEIRSLAEFVYAHPNIFGILGFHCGCDSVLRPPSTGSDDDIILSDLEKMKEIGKKGEELTGFKLRAVTEYKPDDSKPIALKGHFHDWGYRHLGLFVFEIELGNIYNSNGITTEQYFEASDEERRDFELVALTWHDQHPEKEAFGDWRPFEHPQLGEVEIGGWRRHFVANPASEDMESIAAKCTAFILDHAGRRPLIKIVKVEVAHMEGKVHRVLATVMNTGDLATQVTELGHRVTQNDGVRVRLEGAEVLSRGAVQEIGHLGGVSGHRDLEWFVRGEPGSQVRIVAVAQKGGEAEASVTL